MVESPTTRAAVPRAIIAGGRRARLPVISATMSITPRRAWEMLPKQATIPTIMKGAGLSGTDGATGCRRCHIPAPTKAPITMPGPKMPPEPPDPTDNEVARIFTNGRASTTHTGTADGLVMTFCTQP
jgi:hypothetical protein